MASSSPSSPCLPRSRPDPRPRRSTCCSFPCSATTTCSSDLPGIDDGAPAASSGARGASGEFRAKLFDVLRDAGRGAGRGRRERIALVGAGADDGCDAERVRRVGADRAATPRGVWAATSVGFLVAAASMPSTLRQHGADGLSAAEFDGGIVQEGRPAGARRIRLASRSSRRAPTRPRSPRPSAAAASSASRANFTRALANEPANVLHAARVRRTRRRPRPRRVGLGGRRARRARASANSACGCCSASRRAAPSRRASSCCATIRRARRPRRCSASSARAITFDTGGISIKPADGMERMKDDMAGGAAVAGAMRALARLGAPFRVDRRHSDGGEHARRPRDAARRRRRRRERQDRRDHQHRRRRPADSRRRALVRAAAGRDAPRRRRDADRRRAWSRSAGTCRVCSGSPQAWVETVRRPRPRAPAIASGRCRSTRKRASSCAARSPT